MNLKKKKVTMSQIAAKATVSQSTVSLVLNHSQNIKIAQATRNKILRIAQEMGYEHKIVEHEAKVEKIMLIINGFVNYDPFLEALNAIQTTAWQYDKLLSIFSYENDESNLIALKKEIKTGNYIGVIYASTMTQELAPLEDIHVPIVMLNAYSKDSRCKIPSILPADKIGGYAVTEHLLQQGFKNIALLAGELWMDATNDRIDGYYQALVDNDIKPNKKNILVTNWSLKEAYQKTLQLLNLKIRPEAIFCSSDYLALGCYQAILSKGLKIPEDIAVIGYDDQSLSAELTPTLSSFKLPYYEMGEKAVITLIDIIQKQPLLSLNLKVEGHLVIRESSIK